MTAKPRRVGWWSIGVNGWRAASVDLDLVELGSRVVDRWEYGLRAVRRIARRGELGRRDGRVCCHQSVVGYRNGMLRCTDLCGQLFESRDAWIEAIFTAAVVIAERAVVRPVKGEHR